MKPIICIALLAALLLSGCKHASRPAGSSEMPAPEIQVAHPVQQDVTYSYEYPAYLTAEQTVNLVARVNGFLNEILFTPGQRVKAGQLLFVIEPGPYKDNLKSAEASVKSSEAQLTYARNSYEKMKEAVSTRAVSEIDYIQSEASYHEAEAALLNAKAELSTARINLDYCFLKAPFDGRITRNMVDQGNYVGNAGQPTMLATLYRDNQMYAYFSMAYPEFLSLPDTINSITVTIEDAAEANRRWEGKLNYAAPDVDLKTGTVNVRAIIRNPKGELFSGMYIKIHIPYRMVPNALLIPESSIGTNQGGRFVYTVNPGNQVELTPVKVGFLENNGLRQIISGISKDDRYVVDALISVRPGMKIKPAENPAKGKNVRP